MWNKTLLTTLWIPQISIAIYHVVDIAISQIQYHLHCRHYSSCAPFQFSELIWPSICLLSLFLTAWEIFRFKQWRLLPPFFTITQATRFVVVFYHLWPLSSLHKYRLVWSVPIPVFCFTFLIGTIYGLSLWSRWNKLDRLDPRLAQQEFSLAEPNSINRSDDIRTDSSMIAVVVDWIFQPTIQNEGATQSTPAREFANRFFVGLKYVPGLIALSWLMPFTPRLASEPLRSVLNDNPKFKNWNYVRPDFRSRDIDHRPLPVEEESTRTTTFSTLQADTLSLRTLGDEVPITVSMRRQTTFGQDSASPPRLLGPRYLCFVRPEHPKGYQTLRTGDDVPDYIFISYTRRQFHTRITGDTSLSVEQKKAFQTAAERDMAVLSDHAIRAAKAAKVGAFWIDYECCQPEDTEHWSDSVEDVYRICDIVRSAHSLVIVIGPPLNATFQHDRTTDKTTRADWLHDWGRRLWTVPEALLTPSEHRISVYTAGTQEPEIVAKRNLASRVWDDAGTLRQLVEHYEASLPLTQLELISIALECLQRRQTEKRMNGDVAYALMGLLRQRPKIVKMDSDFQAFARLSLANDSDMLLERMICLKPNTIDSAWHDLRDAWKARLWDVYPLCQVADVADNDTIMLGGAQGAMINWQTLYTVDYASVQTRATAWVYARQGPTMLFIFINAWGVTYGICRGILSSIQSRGDDGDYALTVIGTVFGVCCAIVLCLAIWAPLILRSIYTREIIDSQARFFGIEGRPNLDVVERSIFGQSRSRVKWVSSANPDQRSGGGPEALPLRGDDIRQFTLIDTLTCSAMLFEARTPPNIAIACGREHGFLRMVLCSYEDRTRTLCKEAVVRTSTTVLDRMPKLDIFRFSLSNRRQRVEESER